MVRDSARVWNINPKGVGIMGSSAGGHLASTVATHAAAGVRPDFQILFYPVITFVGKTHKGSLKCFLGKDSTNRAALKEYSNERHVEKVSLHRQSSFMPRTTKRFHRHRMLWRIIRH